MEGSGFEPKTKPAVLTLANVIFLTPFDHTMLFPHQVVCNVETHKEVPV